LFSFLQAAGGVPTEDMYRTFNMGIGLIVACAPANEARVLDLLRAAGEPGAVVIGEMVPGEREVRYD
jgi:phosphoribosylformylglycinamidine cyclo-ligase